MSCENVELQTPATGLGMQLSVPVKNGIGHVEFDLDVAVTTGLTTLAVFLRRAFIHSGEFHRYQFSWIDDLGSNFSVGVVLQCEQEYYSETFQIV